MGYTRSESVKLINAKNVTVNGTIVFKKDTKIDEEKDIVCVNSKQIIFKKYTYIMLNKPLGYVSATIDNKEKTVIDLLDEKLKMLNLFCVGRLDKDTTGLLILTNDGDFCHNLTNPKKEKQKVYEFTLKDEISNLDIQKLQNGVMLKDGTQTKKCKIELKTNTSGTICITEGKYHQVRRMFASVNNKVIALNRVEIAKVKLDANLKLGQYRELKTEEIEKLK